LPTADFRHRGPAIDPRDGTLFAATNHRVYGSTLQRSADTGRIFAKLELRSNGDDHPRVLAILRFLGR
jgi:hypothetical protein